MKKSHSILNNLTLKDMEAVKHNFQIMNHVRVQIIDSTNVFGSVEYLTTIRGIKDYGEYFELEGLPVMKTLDQIERIEISAEILAELGFVSISPEMSLFEEGDLKVYLLRKDLEDHGKSLYHICKDVLPAWEERMYNVDDLFYLHDLQNAITQKYNVRLFLPDLFRKL